MTYRLRVDHLRTAARNHGDATGYAIAQRTGISESSISRILRGTTLPDLRSLLIIASTYGTTVEELIERVEAQAAA